MALSRMLSERDESKGDEVRVAVDRGHVASSHHELALEDEDHLPGATEVGTSKRRDCIAPPSAVVADATSTSSLLHNTSAAAAPAVSQSEHAAQRCALDSLAIDAALRSLVDVGCFQRQALCCPLFAAYGDAVQRPRRRDSDDDLMLVVFILHQPNGNDPHVPPPSRVTQGANRPLGVKQAEVVATELVLRRWRHECENSTGSLNVRCGRRYGQPRFSVKPLVISQAEVADPTRRRVLLEEAAITAWSDDRFPAVAAQHHHHASDLATASDHQTGGGEFKISLVIIADDSMGRTVRDRRETLRVLQAASHATATPPALPLASKKVVAMAYAAVMLTDAAMARDGDVSAPVGSATPIPPLSTPGTATTGRPPATHPSATGGSRATMPLPRGGVDPYRKRARGAASAGAESGVDWTPPSLVESPSMAAVVVMRVTSEWTDAILAS
jgi:hypothetical protein